MLVYIDMKVISYLDQNWCKQCAIKEEKTILWYEEGKQIKPKNIVIFCFFLEKCAM